MSNGLSFLRKNSLDWALLKIALGFSLWSCYPHEHPESSESFCRWRSEAWLSLQSEVYRVSKNRDKTVRCGAPALVMMVSDTSPPNLTY
ncbi:hypothetical protein SKAU_G00137310 [Synaphobranchus kaupii]|uniref:Uncharacterized protein n=1 Tax=Synaphobranchus kaupii TaxID=118154 RepID=A0A9Q1FRJ5_SYNKA|nr:hypothetical protein SKAU_G00137310 [Synaphobranchus kaupii]